MNPLKTTLVQNGPDELEERGGGGCLTLFGLPFLLAGIFVVLAALGVIPLENAEDVVGWKRIGFFLFGLPFVAVGTALVFGRSGTVFDRRTGRIVTWKGLLKPMTWKETTMARFNRVVLSRESDEGSDSFPVELKGTVEKEKLRIRSGSDFLGSRQAAETLARFLNFPLEDFTSGRRTVREPDRLNESIRDRARRLDERVSVPPLPLQHRTRIIEMPNRIEVLIPAAALKAGMVAGVVIPLVVGGLAANTIGRMVGRPDTPEIVRWFFWGILGLVLGLPMLLTLLDIVRKSMSYTRVTADRARLVIEEKHGFQRKMTEMPADEIESFDYGTYETLLDAGGSRQDPAFQAGDTGTPRLPDGRPVPGWLVKIAKLAPSRGITAVSDCAVVNFGAGLPNDELKHVHAVLLRALIGA